MCHPHRRPETVSVYLKHPDKNCKLNPKAADLSNGFDMPILIGYSWIALAQNHRVFNGATERKETFGEKTITVWGM
jgi:hypothetical protein